MIMNRIPVYYKITIIIVATVAILAFVAYPYMRYYCGHKTSLYRYLMKSHECESGERLSDMRRLWSIIQVYKKEHGSLPVVMDDIKIDNRLPVNWSKYEYNIAGDAFIIKSIAKSIGEVSYIISDDGKVHYSINNSVSIFSPCLED
jgi:hypothetical protein